MIWRPEILRTSPFAPTAVKTEGRQFMMPINCKWLALPATLGLCLALSFDSPSGVASPHIPPSNKPQVTSIGDVTITSVGIRSNLRRGTLVFTGPDVVMASRDSTQPTQFRLLADEVNAKRAIGNKENGTIDLSGHIRYTITQQTKQGMRRTIQGTAGHAAYEQATKRVLLTEGVQATMTEEAGKAGEEKLEGPATLRSSTATIFTDRSQRYELDGDPAVNDIKFTPSRKGNAKDNKPAQPMAGTPVHIHSFKSGVIDQGHNIVVNGPEAIVDF